MSTFEKLDGTTQPTFHIGGPVGPGLASDANTPAVNAQTADGVSLVPVRVGDAVGQTDAINLETLRALLARAGIAVDAAPPAFADPALAFSGG